MMTFRSDVRRFELPVSGDTSYASGCSWNLRIATEILYLAASVWVILRLQFRIMNRRGSRNSLWGSGKFFLGEGTSFWRLIHWNIKVTEQCTEANGINCRPSCILGRKSQGLVRPPGSSWVWSHFLTPDLHLAVGSQRSQIFSLS